MLFDPGNFTVAQNDVWGVDLILVTHEHQDHLDVASLKSVLAKNPGAKVITNKGVGALLDKESIKYDLLEHGQSLTYKGVLIEAFGKEHAVIYPTLPTVSNTGYFIANRLFFPGDAFVNPGKPVEILALPANAPWSNIRETIDYAREIGAKVAFPVHDGLLKKPEFIPRFLGGILGALGVKLVPIEIGKPTEF